MEKQLKSYRTHILIRIYTFIKIIFRIIKYSYLIMQI